MVVVISTEDEPQVDDLIYAYECPGIVKTPKNDYAKFRSDDLFVEFAS
jgi:hypothetical protein